MPELDVVGAKIPIPSFNLGGTSIIIILSILAFAFAGAVIIYLIYQWRLFGKKIVVFENISGQGYQPTYRDKARLIMLGDGGEELLFLKKKKLYRTAYGKKMGKNTYWFAVGQDGYWYNCVLGDIDAKMGMLDIEPIDRDMRYMHVAVRKNIQDRYRKTKFMEKYGTIVMSGFFLLVMLIGIWFLLDKIAGIATASESAVIAAKSVNDASAKLISGLDNICSSSGVRSVG